MRFGCVGHLTWAWFLEFRLQLSHTYGQLGTILGDKY
jgi:hypothetical protein